MPTRSQADLTAAIAFAVLMLALGLGRFADLSGWPITRGLVQSAVIALPPAITMTTRAWLLPFWIAAMLAFSNYMFGEAAKQPDPASLGVAMMVGLWVILNAAFVIGRLIALLVGLDGFGTSLGYLNEDQED